MYLVVCNWGQSTHRVLEPQESNPHEFRCDWQVGQESNLQPAVLETQSHAYTLIRRMSSGVVVAMRWPQECSSRATRDPARSSVLGAKLGASHLPRMLIPLGPHSASSSPPTEPPAARRHRQSGQIVMPVSP